MVRRKRVAANIRAFIPCRADAEARSTLDVLCIPRKGIDNADRSRVDGHGRFMSCDEHSQLNLNMHLLKLQQTIKLAHISTHIESDVGKLSAAVNIGLSLAQPPIPFFSTRIKV